MTEILDTINNNQGTVSLIFSFVVAISTAIYAFLTWRLTSETIKMRKAQTEPRVVVFLERSHAAFHFFDLVIMNAGIGPAYNVTFEILEEFSIKDEKKLSEMDFIREGISYMPPKYTLRSYFFNFLGDNYENIIDKKIKVEVTYKNVTKEKISEVINLNMSQFKGIQSLGEDALSQMAKNMESLSKDVGYLTSGSRRLRVDTYTSNDRERMAEDYKMQREKLQKKTTEEKNPQK